MVDCLGFFLGKNLNEIYFLEKTLLSTESPGNEPTSGNKRNQTRNTHAV